jgi:P pilus assembly chaperone PapD
MKILLRTIQSMTIVLLLLALPLLAEAAVGVGVGTGKIQVDEPLTPGAVNTLPAVTVINTGDETSSYTMSIDYHENQEEMRPPAEWFVIQPDTFSLEPGKTKQVSVQLDIPVKTQPGDYFAFLEARPVNTSESGGTNIGIAAATKLNFSVAPANIIQGAYYRTLSILERYSPWSYSLIAIILATLLVVYIKRRYSFSIGVERK